MNSGQIVLLYDAKALSGDAAAQDVVAQMDAIDQALRPDFDCIRLPVTLDFRALRSRLTALRPVCVVNLVESLDGADRLQTIIPMLLEEWRIPFTGSGSLAMHIANDKIAAKRLLSAYAIPTPGCAWLDNGTLIFLPEKPEETARDWIIKTRESHASLFLNDSSVLRNADSRTLADQLRQAETTHGQPFFAEQFIDGREFNLSLLPDPAGKIVVLPAAEISFAGLAAGKPRIVGYDAKWLEESAEYSGTPRVFPGPSDKVLVDKLESLAIHAWQCLSLSGYARVDFRVDEDSNPFVLEANANPCLSPDAGFAAAAAQAGLSFRDMVIRIIGAAQES